MADLGKILLMPKGEYSAEETYSILDVVTFDRSSYVLKTMTSKGVEPTDDSAWQLLSEHGADAFGFGYIMYSENSDGTDFVDTPTDKTKYVGFYMGDAVTPPSEKEAYKWSKFVGEDGTTPLVTVTRQGDSVVITIVDAKGTTTETITDGKNGNRWFRGTQVNASTLVAEISGDPRVNDNYLNTEEGKIYHCTVAGTPSTWEYDMTLTGGGTGGVTNYAELEGKPQIEGHELNSGNNTAKSLGLAVENHKHTVEDITDADSIVKPLKDAMKIQEQSGYLGKNILVESQESKTKNGVTLVNNGDGTYTLNGTADANDSANFYLGTPDNLLPYRGKLRLVGAKDGVVLQLRDAEYGVLATDSGEGVTRTMSEGFMIAIRVEKGTTVTNAIVKPMLTTDFNATYDDFVPNYPSTKELVGPDRKIKESSLTESLTQKLTKSAPTTEKVGQVPVIQEDGSVDWDEVKGGHAIISDKASFLSNIESNKVADALLLKKNGLVEHGFFQMDAGKSHFDNYDGDICTPLLNASDDASIEFFFELTLKVGSTDEYENLTLQSYKIGTGADKGRFEVNLTSEVEQNIMCRLKVTDF